MHKKLEAELVSLAHQILQMKDKGDIVKLKNKAKDLYEKLAVIAFVDNYFLTTPNALENKNELTTIVENITNKDTVVAKEKEIKPPKKITKVVKEEKKADKEDSKIVKKLEKQTSNTITAEAEEIINKIIKQEATHFKDDINEVTPINDGSLANNEEFKDTIPADVAADLFEKATNLEQQIEKQKVIKDKSANQNVATKIGQKQNPKPVTNQPKKITKTSLNDRLSNQKIQVGLNDRIAFVKHLFSFIQEDFNRVLSQLNTFKNETEAKNFINNEVKPRYDWTGKEEFEERFIALIERKFL